MIFHDCFIFQELVKAFSFRELIHVVFTFLIKCRRFVETASFRRSVSFSFRALLYSSYCAFQSWNEWKNHCHWNALRSHRVKHELCFRHVFNFFLFRLSFKTLMIECFVKFFAEIALSFWCIFLMKIFCKMMLLRTVCAALFAFAKVCSMIIILTFCALFNSAVSFVIFYYFYVWLHNYFQLNQPIRGLCAAYSHHH